jgi:hypothetical protein
MKSNLLKLLFTVAFAFSISFIGCEKAKEIAKTIEEKINENKAVQEALNSDEFDDLFESMESNLGDGFTKTSASLGADTLRFKRLIKKPSKSDRTLKLIKATADTDTVWVQMTQNLTGKLKIWIKTPTGVDTVIKDINDKLTRNAVMVRVNKDSTEARKRWKLYAISMVDIKTVNGTGEFEITQLTIDVHTKAGGKKTFTVTNPLETYMNHGKFTKYANDIPLLSPGDSVKVTMKLKDSGPTNELPELAAIHHGAKRHNPGGKKGREGFLYIKLKDEYVKAFIVGSDYDVGKYHAVVDVLDRACVYNKDATAAPYNSVAWGIPYAVIK